MNKKRERSINFNKQEVNLLLKLVEDKKDIVNNKKSDAATWQEKNNCWKGIEKAFNSINGNTFRTSKTLRLKYEGIKKQLRRKGFRDQVETYATVGGFNAVPQLVLTEDRLKTMGLLPVDGTESDDSDPLNLIEAVEDNESEPDEPIRSTSNNFEMKTKVEVDVVEKLPQWKPKVLKSRRHPGLFKQRPRRPIEKVAEAKLEVIKLQKKILEEELQYNREKREMEREQLQTKRERLEMAKVQQQKRWDFEEEEREHKRQMWELENPIKVE